ncbi:MAG: hypothetical protein R3E89_13125 [Thiolinea sp.]
MTWVGQATLNASLDSLQTRPAGQLRQCVGADQGFPDLAQLSAKGSLYDPSGP